MNQVQDRTVNPNKTIKASFLIAGTCIGGGMLALPLSGSVVGFFPSIFVMLLCCWLMTASALLYLEATLWFGKEAHLNTLSTELLSPFWRSVCWLIYLFICYASLTAYISGGSKEIAFVLSEGFDIDIHLVAGMIFFTAVFGTILYLGHRFVERVNSILFISMIIAYGLLLLAAGNKLNVDLLNRQDWGTGLIYLFPIMLTTFSFPGVVPTIVPYLEYDHRAVRKAIVWGTGITFLVYFLWLLLVFGAVPHEGELGLKEAFLCDIPATECLHYALKNPYISAIAQFFAFFALATSFLGISLSLFDFLKDTFKSIFPALVNKKSQSMIYCSIVLVPSFIFASLFEKAFIVALELSGGIGDAILSGVIPALMVWNGRYYYQKQGKYQVKGGKGLLISVMFFAGMILFFEVFRRIG